MGSSLLMYRSKIDFHVLILYPEVSMNVFLLILIDFFFLVESFSLVQLLSHVWLFATSWTAACQTSLSITTSQSLPKLMSIESVMPSNHLILCRIFRVSYIKKSCHRPLMLSTRNKLNFFLSDLDNFFFTAQLSGLGLLILYSILICKSGHPCLISFLFKLE